MTLERTPSLLRSSPSLFHPHATFTQESKPTRVSILGSDSYIVGYHLLTYLTKDILKFKSSTFCIVTDEHLHELGHLDRLHRELSAVISSGTTSPRPIQITPPRILSFVIPPGESYKTREFKAEIEDWMLSNGVTRDSILIALGGGVVGDMVGFVAATFMRGIPVIQIPTTLLAMVDSAIGGKTAIDTPQGKNLVGAFHQPKRIFADLEYLTTLPPRQIINGMAEIVKTAAFWSEDDFIQLEEGGVEKVLQFTKGNLNQSSKDTLHRLVVSSARIKAHVVTNDEKEGGLREILNFGHSIGHAIEALLSPWNILHGECVAMGMIYECQVSRALGICDQTTIGRLSRVLTNLGLPTSLQDAELLKRTNGMSGKLQAEKILEVMKVDKKNQGTQKRIVLLKCIGQLYEKGATAVSDRIIAQVLSPSVIISPPKTIKDSKVTCPGSKSISNRALLLAALGKGTVKLEGMLHSDDTQVMLEALKKLSVARFEYESDGRILVVHGGGGRIKSSQDEIYLGNAGTASRFLTTVVSLIKDGDVATILTGNPRMKQRPIGDLVNALNKNGSDIKYLEKEGSLPLKIEPTGFKGGEIVLAANISSQFVSSILLASPYAEQDVVLKLDNGEIVSQSYIDMTISMMKDFGIIVEKLNERTYKIPVGVYVNPGHYLVEADASSATYPLGFAAITASSVTVTNIGSKSLQGDAKFAVDVLEKMGCIVQQGQDWTRVTGPPRGELKAIKEIDMEPLTDAFLTASVLMAVAQGTSKIIGIANQRVKECDRINAMATQLSKFGVKVEELEDGLIIHGQNVDSLVPPSDGVECYDDHRIAMSFSILAAALKDKETIIQERRCVEKTWPDWWDCLERDLGVQGNAYDHGHVISQPPTRNLLEMYPFNDVSKDVLDDVTLVLIGMRGAGKTTLGKAASLHLGRKFIDMDHYFEQSLEMSIQDFLRLNKWDEFRKKECEFLEKVLKENPKNAVISCGGGIVETERGRNILTQWKSNGLVLHIRRDINDVITFLTSDTSRPAFPDDLHTVWLRRLPWFDECSNHEFVVYPGLPNQSQVENVMDPEIWKGVEHDLGKFLNQLFGKVKALPSSPSYFLSLTFDDMQNATPFLNLVTHGVDAVELRVDLLKSWDEEFVGLQVATLRRSCNLPIIFTVRTKSQGGLFPNDLPSMFDLLFKAVKWNCEFIDVEAIDEKDPTWLNLVSKLQAVKGKSRLIMSFHDLQGLATWDETTVNQSNLASGINAIQYRIKFPQKYRSLCKFGDIVKLIGMAKSRFDNHALERFLARIEMIKPLIALNMGSIGQESRALCPFLTPVTHPALPISAAPGQLSVKEINQLRHLLGVETKKDFFLFGEPIKHSSSPLLHNTGFETLGFPHVYFIHETSDAENVRELVEGLLSKGKFGGASVTIPLKEVMNLPLFLEMTTSAEKIGAINTLVPIYNDSLDKGYGLIGDNTDWLGITRCIKKSIQSKNPIGIVIGGGGTARAACFALKQLGVSELRIWNRTGEKAQVLASNFDGIVVGRLEDLLKGGRQFIILATIPASAQESLQLSSLFDNPPTTQPDEVDGVIVELAYKPRETPLLHLARNQKEWKFVTVEGIEVLLEQGFEQFHRWTGRLPPEDVIRKAVYSKYNSEN